MFEKYKKVYKADYEKWYKENEAYRQRVAADQDRLKFHLMPKTGWLNDPNGLCQFNGTYHIYYQYTPFEPTGELKTWGHYTTKDFIHYEDFGPVVFPDEDMDAHGVYSGSAFIEDDTIHYFYTGNLKYFDRDDYDYINSGRGSNTITFTSKDGYEFTKKELLMTTDDYPADMSNHVRDPKIFKKNEKYYMVLGARDVEGVGMILLYESTDLKNWTYKNRITTPQKFGYMWECPDLFEMDGQLYIICCPQGVETQGIDYENVHQVTAMKLDYDFDTDKYEIKDIKLFDRGFDFYAPQTMETEDGRRILIGWMQSWDNPMYPDTQRYSGMMTVPRELSMKGGRICQKPVRELENYRSNVISYDNVCIHEETELKGISGRSIDLEIALKGKEYGKFRIKLAADEKHYSEIIYDKDEKTLTFDRTHSGFKKDTISTRSMYVSDKKDVINLRILVDRFSVEIFVNDGEQVMTSLIYTPVDASGISFASNGNTHLDVTKYDIEVK